MGANYNQDHMVEKLSNWFISPIVNMDDSEKMRKVIILTSFQLSVIVVLFLFLLIDTIIGYKSEFSGVQFDLFAMLILVIPYMTARTGKFDVSLLASNFSFAAITILYQHFGGKLVDAMYYIIIPLFVSFYLVSLVNAIKLVAMNTSLILIYVLEEPSVSIGAFEFHSIPFLVLSLAIMLVVFHTSQIRKEEFDEVLQRVHLMEMDAVKHELSGKMIQGVAHDYKHILQVISSYIDLIEAENASNSYINSLRNVVETSSEFMEDLVEFTSNSKSNGGECTDLHQSIGYMTSLVQKMSPSNVVITYQLEATRHMIPLTKSEIDRILLNMMVNATDALGINGGEVKIITNYLHNPDQNSKNQNVSLIIADNGVGMTTDMLGKIFDFKYTTKERGSGIGLFSVKEIVNHYNGSIVVESELGRGTTFHLMIPLMEPQNEGI